RTDPLAVAAVTRLAAPPDQALPLLIRLQRHHRPAPPLMPDGKHVRRAPILPRGALIPRLMPAQASHQRVAFARRGLLDVLNDGLSLRVELRRHAPVGADAHLLAVRL